jgi:hypothetical protein
MPLAPGLGWLPAVSGGSAFAAGAIAAPDLRWLAVVSGGRSSPQAVAPDLRWLALLAAGSQPVVAANLMAAVAATAAADPTLSGIAKFYRSSKPPDAASLEPYCVFNRAGSSQLLYTSTSEWKDERVKFCVYASDPDTAESLGEQLIQSVKAWGPLLYATGYSIPLKEVGVMSGATKNRRTGDKASWSVDVTFSARCRRGLT